MASELLLCLLSWAHGRSVPIPSLQGATGERMGARGLEATARAHVMMGRPRVLRYPSLAVFCLLALLAVAKVSPRTRAMHIEMIFVSRVITDVPLLALGWCRALSAWRLLPCPTLPPPAL
jgi:hypothetical protein